MNGWLPERTRFRGEAKYHSEEFEDQSLFQRALSFRSEYGAFS